MPAGKKQAKLNDFVDQWLDQVLERRVLDFDTAAAEKAAELEAAGVKTGRMRELRDTMIAGIVQATRATLATRNVKHFEDIAASVVNPWEA
jgi:hypothetical protein